MSESPGNQSLPAPGIWRRLRRNRLAMAGLWLLMGLVLLAIVGVWLNPYLPNQTSDRLLEAPSRDHWLGTDHHGRDVFARLIAGSRLSLFIGLAGAGVSVCIGVAWGMVAGYVGGRTDGLLMRFVDVLYSLPNIIFVIVLITTFESHARKWVEGLGLAWGPMGRMAFLFLGLGGVSWLTMSRIVRGQVLILKERAFISASVVLGATHGRILIRHVLPNLIGIVIAYLTLTLPGIILYESFLSYLGLGVQPPQSSLGTLLAEGAGQLNPMQSSPWLLFGPASYLVGGLLALNLIGDGLRDALDPRQS